MKKKFLAGLAVGVLMLELIGTAKTKASTFTDNFDSINYTDSNWTSIFPPTTSSWTHIGASGDVYEGYQGAANTAYHTAAAIAGNTQYLNSNLTVEAILKVGPDQFSSTHDIGGVFAFADMANSDTGFTAGFTTDTDQLFISKNYDGSLTDIGNSSDEVSTVISTGLDSDRLYKLILSTDFSLISLSIFDDFGANISPLGTITYNLNDVPSSFGFTGIVAQELATFDYFSVNGTAAPVPEPATMFLFATGLAGLAGTRLRRKYKK